MKKSSDKSFFFLILAKLIKPIKTNILSASIFGRVFCCTLVCKYHLGAMTHPNVKWGEIIEKTINFGREERSHKLKKIEKFDVQYENFTHCSHIMIYARTKSDFETFPKKALILMQMRFDGSIGFPGGIVDSNETPLQAVCREVKEEVGWDCAVKGIISDHDYQFTHVDDEKQLVLHFYAIEITEAELVEIEKNLTTAKEYGNEVLGHFRVPLYTMGDAFRGFPAFLKNHFVDNAKLQLIETIINLELLSEEQIVQALHSAPKITF